jgi:predicted nucleic acid-binding protein
MSRRNSKQYGGACHSTSDFAPKLWSDAYLAAFAIAGGYQLVTFDRGFKQYANLTATLLP